MTAIWFSSAIKRHSPSFTKMALSALQTKGDIKTADQIAMVARTRIAITRTRILSQIFVQRAKLN